MPLSITMPIPPGLYGHTAPHTKLALHNNINISGGVINPDCRGELNVLIVISIQKKFEIKDGNTISQIIYERDITPSIRTIPSLNAIIKVICDFVTLY